MKKRLIIACVTILIGISVWFGYSYFNSYERRLNRLDYSKEAITKILDQDIDNIKEYSKTLEVIILDDHYQEKYFNDYFNITYKEHEQFPEDVNDLLLLGYPTDFINEAFIQINQEQISSISTTYSKTLEVVILNHLANTKYLNDYVLIEYHEAENFITDINQLLSIGYNGNQINGIISTFAEEEISTLKTMECIPNAVAYKNISVAKISHYPRYQAYQDKTTLNAETSVIHVEIGLDQAFYTQVLPALHLNTNYVLVNKYHQLDMEYQPNNLVKVNTAYSINDQYLSKDANAAFETMCNDIVTLGYSLKAVSTYRGYATQQYLYNEALQKYGFASAERSSARPGFSEHQTGLAIDVASGTSYKAFNATKEYVWVKENAHKYGFIIRYQEKWTPITGYMDEAWHLRYVGEEIATFLYNNPMTFEEYYVRYINQ